MKKFLKWIERTFGNLGYFLLPLNVVAFDKQKHLLAGWFFAFISFFIIHTNSNKEKLFAFICSIFIALLVGIIKEINDQIVKKAFNVPDLIYTIIGGIIGSIMAFIFYRG